MRKVTRISTHTSTRDATIKGSFYIPISFISTHTSTRNATSAFVTVTLPTPYFNPRTHAGCGQVGTSSSLHSVNFNPHAMQLANYIYDMLKKYFNPHIHVRFNVDSKYMAAEVVNFNPHIRAGCDSNNK